ncbi:MAG: glucosamine-6-phosphate deaminase, partial [Oscillospiraceae bacterium]|nr:glucosamine-6-phosphate deaminase [Oscillospiraceae bacterium]
MKVIRTDAYEESARVAAGLLLEELAVKPDLLMGLATGSSAEGVYAEMVRAYRAGKADFSRARTVNLDEYAGCAEAHSYRKFMDDHLFSRVNLP